MRGDATIDIPLSNVPSGAARTDSITPLRSKQGTSTANQEKRRTLGHRGRKKDTKVGYDGEEETLNSMGRVYRRILDFSIITRYFVYVLPLALVIAVPIGVGATVAPNAKIGGVPLRWFFTWVEISMLSQLWSPSDSDSDSLAQSVDR